MRNMYDRFRLRYQIAVENLPKIQQDEGFMDIVCFDTQQALEFLIKHILNSRNALYRKTHSIQELLAVLKDSGFSFKLQEEAVYLADTITSWETGSRYGSGVYTTTELIQKVFAIIDSINVAYKEDINDMEKLINLNKQVDEA